MSRLKEYNPIKGKIYQIFVKCPNDKKYKHCDYAKDSIEKIYLLAKHRKTYGEKFVFKTVLLPKKYWKK